MGTIGAHATVAGNGRPLHITGFVVGSETGKRLVAFVQIQGTTNPAMASVVWRPAPSDALQDQAFSMVRTRQFSTTARLEVWILDNPAASASGTITFTRTSTSTTVRHACGVQFLYDMDTTTVWRADTDAAAAANPSATVTSASGDIVLSAAGSTGGSSGADAATPNSPGTELWLAEQQTAGGSYRVTVGHWAGSSPSVTTAWTSTSAALISVSIPSAPVVGAARFFVSIIG